MLWNGPAFEAGLSPGMKAIAANGKEVSGNAVKEAVTAAAKDKSASVELHPVEFFFPRVREPKTPACCELPTRLGVTFPGLLDIVIVSPETMLGQSREASFTELYSRYARDIYRFAFYLSGDSSLADDVTSETFLRVWLTDTPIRPETVKSWLLTIARNLFRHELRHLRRTQELPTDLRGPDSVVPAVQAKQELARVMAALANLAEMDRSALLLRSVEGCSYQEIAAILGISLASAKVKVHRARMRLGQLRDGEVSI